MSFQPWAVLIMDVNDCHANVCFHYKLQHIFNIQRSVSMELQIGSYGDERFNNLIWAFIELSL